MFIHFINPYIHSFIHSCIYFGVIVLETLSLFIYADLSNNHAAYKKKKKEKEKKQGRTNKNKYSVSK